MTSYSIENARVFDGNGLSEPRTVFVLDGLITDAAGANPEIVDAQGGTLLPGLIDGHVHIDDPSQAATLAQWGVTSAMDMGAKDPAVIDGLRSATGVANVSTAGFPAAPTTGTHIARLGYPVSAGISTPGEAGAWVTAQIASGSDYIKLLLEVSMPGQPEPLNPETASAIVTAAHAAGKRVIAHTTTGATAALAVKAGVDAITHTPLGEVLSEEFANQLAAGGIVAIPTLSLMSAMASNWPFPVRPPTIDFANALTTIGRFRDAGVTIVAGTDSNANPATPAQPPHGQALHGELELMVAAGLTPVEALRAATSTAADFFGLTDRGRIENGSFADLVLVDGDPTSDISATRNIRGVWIAGERVR